MNIVRATPFHARTAEANVANLWTARAGYTLAAAYSDPSEEAVAARMGVAMADISWRWQAVLEGARVRELVQLLFTRDVTGLAPGQASKALWLADGGGVRGAGVVARLGRQAYRVVAAADDAAWIAAAAAQFDCTVRTEEEGGLALIGPFAARLVAALGFDPALELSAFRKTSWKGIDATLARFGEHGGYEIWCGADDATLVWDRVARAGAAFGILPAGLQAMDILDIEAGVPRPGRDYAGAIESAAAEPLAGEWRLEKLIDPEHRGFNGERAARAAAPRHRLVGLVFDSVTPAPFAPVLMGGRPVGRTLSSCYSPALRRAIALAEIEVERATPGTAVSLMLPASRTRVPAPVEARVTDLPFLAPPDPITP